MTDIPTLTTDRLTLRPYARRDFDAYAAFFASAERTRYMGGPRDAEGAWAWFTNDHASWDLYGFGCLALTIDGDMIGFTGIVQPPHFPEPECGWGLFEGHEGKGYVTEAGRAILAHAFATTQLSTIVSYVDQDNARSRAVAERLGGVIDADANGPWDGDDDLVYRYTQMGVTA